MIGFRDESETTTWILYTITQSYAILKTMAQGFFYFTGSLNCIADKTLTRISKKEEKVKKKTEYESDRKAKSTRVRSYQGRIILQIASGHWLCSFR